MGEWFSCDAKRIARRTLRSLSSPSRPPRSISPRFHVHLRRVDRTDDPGASQAARTVVFAEASRLCRAPLSAGVSGSTGGAVTLSFTDPDGHTSSATWPGHETCHEAADFTRRHPRTTRPTRRHAVRAWRSRARTRRSRVLGSAECVRIICEQQAAGRTRRAADESREASGGGWGAGGHSKKPNPPTPFPPGKGSLGPSPLGEGLGRGLASPASPFSFATWINSTQFWLGRRRNRFPDSPRCTAISRIFAATRKQCLALAPPAFRLASPRFAS